VNENVHLGSAYLHAEVSSSTREAKLGSTARRTSISVSSQLIMSPGEGVRESSETHSLPMQTTKSVRGEEQQIDETECEALQTYLSESLL
jgi:hypothetical protein